LVGKRQLTDETKWQDWIRRESIKRFAHFIFINDTQHSCIFGHQGIMSVWEMRLAMPCSDALWSAPTSQEWRRIMAEERKAKGNEAPMTLLDIVTAFMSPNGSANGGDPRVAALDGLGLYLVVHGIFSIAWHYRNRKIPHYWAAMMNIKPEEQNGEEDTRWLLTALHDWKSRFNVFWSAAHYPIGYQPPSPMWSPRFRLSALAIYDLACIWLQAPISDFQMAAGSRFAHGRLVSKHRAQQSWIRINKKTLSDDVCHHALNLVEAELVYHSEATGQPGLHSYLTDPSYPLFMPFVAYLGGLSLWAYAFHVERQPSYVQSGSVVPLEQNNYHVNSFGINDYRLPSSAITGYSNQHFSNSDDYREIIHTLRGNLTLSFSNADVLSPSNSLYTKSPATTNNFQQLGGNQVRLSLIKQGIDILLGYLRDQLDGHRWEIARESFEILQGTTNQNDYA
jgi:Fungal specific transcription factor domain